MHGVSDCARSIPYSPSVAWDDVAFSSEKWIGTSERPVSQLNTQPMVSPVNASRQPSRTAAHHSGPERLARPYSAVDFHLLSFASLSWRSLFIAISRLSVFLNRNAIWHITILVTGPLLILRSWSGIARLFFAAQIGFD